MPNRRKLVAAIASVPVLAGFPALARAQSPAPIRMMVGFPAGGTIDVVARILADRLKDELGAPVVVESRVGAGGAAALGSPVQADTRYREPLVKAAGWTLQ